jgi:hypothetical protein
MQQIDIHQYAWPYFRYGAPKRQQHFKAAGRRKDVLPLLVYFELAIAVVPL